MLDSGQIEPDTQQTFDALIASANDMKASLEAHNRRWMISTAILVITLIAVTAALIIYIMLRRSTQRNTIVNIQEQLQSLEGGNDLSTK